MLQDIIHQISSASSFEDLKRFLSNAFGHCGEFVQRGTTKFEPNSLGPAVTISNNGTGPALQIGAGGIEYTDEAPPAAFIEGTVNAAFTTSDETVQGTVEFFILGRNPGTTVTLVNPDDDVSGTDQMFDSDQNGRFWAYYEPVSETYRMHNVQCPA